MCHTCCDSQRLPSTAGGSGAEPFGRQTRQPGFSPPASSWTRHGRSGQPQANGPHAIVVCRASLDQGAVTFTLPRTERGGRRFSMYKIRSIVSNAEELKRELAHLNELGRPDFKITHDPRVTSVGHVLRKTSLDELPQIWNIVRGEMFLVGPRPTSFGANTSTQWQTERLDVAPDLSGLWQITGRGITGSVDQLRLDIAYAERRCLWLDTEILVRTIMADISALGAN
ncbi:MAG TPA: sugar transferase [Thermomicrobiales bacterium]|nr:sugar transferase [Thermomicrobiales bacterium]